MSSNRERYSLEQALYEAEKLKSKVDSGEATGCAEAEQQLGQSKEQTPESEFSPEVNEKIMEKVQDINRSGIAFSALGELPSEKLKSVLKNGLLGDNWREKEGMGAFLKDLPDGIEAQAWATKTRKNKNTIVHFNITGRMEETKIWNENKKRKVFSHGGKEVKSQIDLAGWTYYRRNGITILFDPSHFREIEQNEWKTSASQLDDRFRQGRPKTFVSDAKVPKGHPTDTPEAEYGFNLWHRVAPKYFTGIIMRLDKPLPEITDAYVRAYLCGFHPADDPEMQRQAMELKLTTREEEFIKRETPGFIKRFSDPTEQPLQDETDQNKVNKRVQEVVQAMCEVDSDKPDRMVPVYNRAGDLLWPEHMSYKQVKKLVAERKKQKVQKEAREVVGTSKKNPLKSGLFWWLDTIG